MGILGTDKNDNLICQMYDDFACENCCCLTNHQS